MFLRLAGFVCAVFLLAGCITPTQNQHFNKVYYSSGVLKSIWVEQNSELNGIKREYTEDGVLKSATNYKNGKIDGNHNTYREDGSLWTKEVYKNGKLLSRQDFDDEGFLTAWDDFTD